MDHYDAIIVGAGHNGLVCAAYLARSGRRVLALDASDSPGGLAADREFHPGFNAPVAHSISHFSSTVARELELAAHGYATAGGPMPLLGLGPNGIHNRITDAGIEGPAAAESEAWQDYLRLMRRCATALAPFWHKKMPALGSLTRGDMTTFGHMGLKLRGLGKKDLREFLRIASLPMRDLMDEHFADDALKATLCWDGLIGAKLAPRSPNAAVLGLLYRMSEASGSAHSIPRGGVAGLMRSLAAAATSAGCDIRCNTRVQRIVVEGDENGLRATGVKLASGETIGADTVVSAVDPKNTFLNLLGVEYLDIGFANRIRRLRCDGYVAKLHLALNSAPEFTGVDDLRSRMIVAVDMDSIEFDYDFAKYGELPAEPVMEIVIPSAHDKSLAPDGQHVLSAHVMYVPYRLKGGWNDAARDALQQRAIETLARYAPGIHERIVASELLTPADLEREFGLTGGHWHHTEMAMDQMLMMRPTYGAAQYLTPVPGLYLASAGCHPGGDLVGAAGYNAAQAMLR